MAKRPSILVLMGDDVGWWNISYNSRGQMGYRTPNIDRVANEGVAFTDYYAQQSCTAGRAAFITGQNPIRTGLSKVGMPGADVGLRREDPTIAELLKPLGYATGQFGKNHLGDKDEFLPTMHGFEEFFGNLYHLNAEEEPEDRNTTAMHFRTHCAEKHKGKSGQGDYNDAMVAHDENVGRMLTKLDDLGIAEDTLVMYTTDNGPHYNTWPDAGITPFRSEKNTNWEGGWRVPAFVRWPGWMKAGTVINGIVSHQDWLPTLVAAAGDPDIGQKLLKGHRIGERFPPRQKPAAFNLDAVLRALQDAGGSANH